MNVLKNTGLENEKLVEEEKGELKEDQLEEEEGRMKKKKTKVFTPLDLLRTKKLRKRTLITCYMW